MAVRRITMEFKEDIKSVWDKVTSLKDYAWRSDVERIEVSEGGREFVEYTKEGYATRFTITAFSPCARYEFDMENGNMKGHWTGLFKEEGGVARLDFTEDVTPKKWFMKPFAGLYLGRQQARYAADLKKALQEGQGKTKGNRRKTG